MQTIAAPPRKSPRTALLQLNTMARSGAASIARRRAAAAARSGRSASIAASAATDCQLRPLCCSAERKEMGRIFVATGKTQIIHNFIFPSDSTCH